MMEVCLGTETMVLLVEGHADTAMRARMETHAARCDSCRVALSALARVATPFAESESSSPVSHRALEPRTQFGRYVFAGELGAGGMGVVYAAHDSELDRMVAVKVLRDGSEPRLQERLRREAQAMAQLAHPNIIAVYDVGVFDERMFIAMEHVDGETLARWSAEPRSQREILEVYCAAGKGLAAAHAAGIVHRDFKPENVLIGRDRRVRVGDFGLARIVSIADLQRGIGPDTQAPVNSAEQLTSLTASGAVVGTPYYMAPELHQGAEADARSDQFSFCVALYRALYGEHPFKDEGPDVRAPSMRGRAHASRKALRIPRRIRSVLQRGLAADPAARFASIDELLTELAPRPGRWARWLVLLGVGLVLIALRTSDELAPLRTCEPPSLDPHQVWSTYDHARVGTQHTAAKLIDADIAAWETTRAATCKQASLLRAPRLLCLDGVLARIQAVAEAARAARDLATQVDAGALLIDPKVCELADIPRLMTRTSPAFRDMMTTRLLQTSTSVPLDPAAASTLIAKAGSDACASSIAHMLVANIDDSAVSKVHHLEEARQDAERCADDRVIAESALSAAQHASDDQEPTINITAKLRLAETLVRRVDQRDLMATIDRIRAGVAFGADGIKEGITHGIAAMEGFAARGRLRAQLDIGIDVLYARQSRATPADLTEIPTLLSAWRARALAELGEADDIVRALDRCAAVLEFSHGDLARAHAQLNRLHSELPNRRSQRLTGTVVDLRGRPVAGATVTADDSLIGDSLGVVDYRGSTSMRHVASGADGRFEIPDAIEDALVIAELGDRRSSPGMGSNELTLQLAPTSRLEGHIALNGRPAGSVMVIVREHDPPRRNNYVSMAPVSSDGSFMVLGVPRRDVYVRAVTWTVNTGTIVSVRGPVIQGISLELPDSTRVVQVIARPTVDSRLESARVQVLPGKVASMNLLEFTRKFYVASVKTAYEVDAGSLANPVRAALRPGDLLATMTEVPSGTASACAYALPRNLSPKQDDGSRHKVQVVCRPIPDAAALITIEVPPLPRLE
jgi:serine/threonine protein kinase